MPGARPVAPSAVAASPVPGAPSRINDDAKQPNQQKSGAPVLDDSFLNLTDSGKQDKVNSKPNEATTGVKKVFSFAFCFLIFLINLQR